MFNQILRTPKVRGKVFLEASAMQVILGTEPTLVQAQCFIYMTSLSSSLNSQEQGFLYENRFISNLLIK